MIIQKTKFKDLLIIKQKNNFDKRGNLREVFNNRILKKKFVFEYCTTSKANVLRGFHFQTKLRQSKYVNVLKGKILDIVIDLRKNSKTFGKVFKIILSQNNSLGLYIPSGFAHAYYSYNKENIIYYKLDNYYAPKHESGIMFNDSIVKIKWPSNMMVSKKDRNLLTYKEFLKKFKAL